MQPQTHTQSKAEVVAVESKPIALFFNGPVNFNNEEHMAIQIGRKVDSFEPVKVLAGNKWRYLKEGESGPDGYVLQRKVLAKFTGQPTVVSSVVLVHMVRSVSYGELP